MSDLLKATIILAATILLFVCVWIYFSPYHSCVRASSDPTSFRTAVTCARALGGTVDVNVN